MSLDSHLKDVFKTLEFPPDNQVPVASPVLQGNSGNSASQTSKTLTAASDLLNHQLPASTSGSAPAGPGDNPPAYLQTATLLSKTVIPNEAVEEFEDMSGEESVEAEDDNVIVKENHQHSKSKIPGLHESSGQK